MKKYLILTLLLTGCAAYYPMGLTEAQWNSMSPAQQQQAWDQQQQQDEAAAYQLQQMQLNNERTRLEGNARMRLGISDNEWAMMTPEKKLELRMQQEAIEREYQANQAAAAYAAQVHAHSNRRLYTNPAHGSLIDCDIKGGNAKFGGKWNNKWAPMAPVHFALARTDAADVPIRRADRQSMQTSFWVGFSPSNELEFCAAENTDKRYKRCRTFSVPQVTSGAVTPLSIPDKIDGATLSCSYTPGRR